MSTRPSQKRALIGLAVAAVFTTLAVASCSGDSGNDDMSTSADEGAGDAVVAEDMSEAPEAAAERNAFGSGEGVSAGSKPATGEVIQLGSAHIKTATIELESKDVAAVVDKIYVLAATSRGSVTSEDTSTNEKGVTARSRLEVKVPVAGFTDAKDEIESFGSGAPHTKTSDVDVTGEVADVNSRVKSAEQSIDQLRALFSRATKLGDIITLERELSRREAELEALQAQQRALAAQTTMSTLLVTVALVDDKATPPTADGDQAGFVAGIKQGWDGFVTFIVGASHALGLILPLGTLMVILGWLAWIVVRRFGLVPGRPAGTTVQPTSTD